MSFTNFQKTIALTSGVLVLSVAVGYIVIAAPWQGPTANPPGDNADAPINVGSDPQTKAGDLTVSELTTSGGRLYLNDSGFEGDIERVDEIIGENDLQLRDSADETKIDLDVGDTGKIEFYTDGTERMVVDAGGELDITGLNLIDCFLMVDEFGKVKCYEGFVPPGGDKLDTSPYISWPVGQNQCVEKTIGGLEDTIVKAYCYTAVWGPHSGGSHAYCRFYIDGSLMKQVESHVHYSSSSSETTIGTFYYNVTPGSVVKICTDSGYYCEKATGNLSKIGSVRADIRYAFVAEGKHILRWYNEGSIGEMEEIGYEYIEDPAVSVRISAMNSAEVSYSE